ncbi:PilN domain-containing protein [Alkalimarinus coralli]|uniref:PilN domain-containing protein n=1 Tax=Alkalimarinus coralli TaxID=2935863 RepID=UPI00202AFCFF|nr:PilN domain-containing protein [Alkalimarinus coralli]
MAKINLRPWREELRAERQKQFVGILVGVLIIAVGAVFLWQGHMTSEIEYQQSRNNYLQSSMTILDKKIKEIEGLKKKKKELLARMKVIQNLQGTRPIIVRVFDELVRTLPDGLYYTKLDKKGDQLSIVGVAESNNRIAGVMRNFEASDWFGDPNLTAVKAVEKGEPASEFTMTVVQKTPEDKKEDKK